MLWLIECLGSCSLFGSRIFLRVLVLCTRVRSARREIARYITVLLLQTSQVSSSKNPITFVCFRFQWWSHLDRAATRAITVQRLPTLPLASTTACAQSQTSTNTHMLTVIALKMRSPEKVVSMSEHVDD